MSTFLTGGDDAGAGAMSEVDRQRQDNREWKARYEEAVRVHELKARENDEQLAVAKRELTRQGEGAAEARNRLEATAAQLERERAEHEAALAALRAESEAEREAEREAAEGRAAVAKEELTVAAAFAEAEHARELGLATTRTSELEAQLEETAAAKASLAAALEEERARTAGLGEEVEGLRARLAEAEGVAARRGRAIAAGVPAVARQCGALRAALAELAAEQRRQSGLGSAEAAQARQALERLAEEQRRTVEAGEAKATSLASELRAVNKGTLTEFEQYTAKISELRAQLVAVDNEKCEARGRAAAAERECGVLRESLTATEQRAQSQAATVANMLSDLEAREAQCNADFAQLRAMGERLQDREQQLAQDREHQMLKDNMAASAAARPPRAGSRLGSAGEGGAGAGAGRSGGRKSRSRERKAGGEAGVGAGRSGRPPRR